jgi:hypothetical protein
MLLTSIDAEPGNDGPVLSRLDRRLDPVDLFAALVHVDDVADPNGVARHVHDPAIDPEVAVRDQLACIPPR